MALIKSWFNLTMLHLGAPLKMNPFVSKKEGTSSPYMILMVMESMVMVYVVQAITISHKMGR